MSRGSIIGPIILILVGGLFLANNVRPDLPALQIVADWWPFLLIAWGFIRFGEILVWHSQGKPLPTAGISGGEWFLAIVITLAGSALFVGRNFADRFPHDRITFRGLELFGEQFDFPLNATFKTGKTPRVQIENLRGNARVVGAETEEIKVTGRNSIRAFDRNAADRNNKLCNLEIVQQGDLILIRTNQDKATGEQRIESELEIIVPKGATVQGRGRFGDFDVSGITGNVDVDSDNAGVRVSDIAGGVRVDLRRSDHVRAVNVKGNVEIRGRGSDVELENIEGTVALNGSYGGEITFRRIAKPIRFESQNTNLRLEKLAGSIQMSHGELVAEDFTGPFTLRSNSKDVELRNFSGGADIQLDRGDLNVRPGRLPLAVMTLNTRAGNVELVLPEKSQFSLSAEVDKGEIDLNLPGQWRVEEEGKGQKVRGAVGTGPSITILSDRGELRIRHGAVETSTRTDVTFSDREGAPPAPKAPTPPEAPKKNLPVVEQ
ncbi:MAG TPA: DUF4097 family beta strand repeat-containing protein [Bryobacteraceae bacterium]|jgi:DUF4097 and DUF4098 domain-containing protein YvlB|nr:DUF4097 family beta strand repeat-containing protein [Bryobacteraceae bacterium]